MWIKIFFIKFEGNIENIRGEAENISILPKNLMKKIEIHIFFLLENEKKVGKIFGRPSDYWTLLFKILTIFLGTRGFFCVFSGFFYYPTHHYLPIVPNQRK